MSPRLCSGPAWGLLQVIEVVRADFNQRAGTRYTRQDLLDPAVNVTIAATTLALIVKSYARNHPNVANMRTDWNNPQFAALVAFGWNAGWSERAGVGRVATYLEQRGIEVNINNVHRCASEAGASKHLANPRKVAWAKSVAKQYFRELAEDGTPPVESREIDMSGDEARPRSRMPSLCMSSRCTSSRYPRACACRAGALRAGVRRARRADHLALAARASERRRANHVAIAARASAA